MTMTKTMTNIQQKLSRAKSDCKDAIATLENLDSTYKVSGSAYTRARDRQAMLSAKIAAADTDFDNANQLIQRHLEKNHFTKTDAVRSAMLEKTEAEAIKAELQRLHKAGELPTLKLKIEASHDAQAYKDAHQLAQDAWGRLQAYTVLVSCGDEMSRAIALMGHVPNNKGIENIINDEEELRERRIGFFWKELKEMAAERSEAVQRPHVVEIGMLEMGPFANEKFITTLEAAKLKKELEGQTIE